MTPRDAAGPVALPDDLRLILRGMAARQALLDAAIEDFDRDRRVALLLVAKRVGLGSVAELLAAYAIDPSQGVLDPRTPPRPEVPHAHDRPQD